MLYVLIAIYYVLNDDGLFIFRLNCFYNKIIDYCVFILESIILEIIFYFCYRCRRHPGKEGREARIHDEGSAFC